MDISAFFDELEKIAATMPESWYHRYGGKFMGHAEDFGQRAAQLDKEVSALREIVKKNPTAEGWKKVQALRSKADALRDLRTVNKGMAGELEMAGANLFPRAEGAPKSFFRGGEHWKMPSRPLPKPPSQAVKQMPMKLRSKLLLGLGGLGALGLAGYGGYRALRSPETSPAA
jgi:hypothetical protein